MSNEIKGQGQEKREGSGSRNSVRRPENSFPPFGTVTVLSDPLHVDRRFLDEQVDATAASFKSGSPGSGRTIAIDARPKHRQFVVTSTDTRKKLPCQGISFRLLVLPQRVDKRRSKYVRETLVIRFVSCSCFKRVNVGCLRRLRVSDLVLNYTSYIFYVSVFHFFKR